MLLAYSPPTKFVFAELPPFSRPNAQAALLIRMVEKFPDTVERLALV
jgi:hypothetical protein